MPSKKYIGRYRPQRNRWAYQRTNLQRAGDIARLMEKSYHVMWPGTFWPSAHCFTTSLILAPIIRSAVEWDVRVTVGRAHNNRPHSWLSSPDDDVIDPTYGQFDYGPALRILPAPVNWVLGHWPEIDLTLQQEQRAFEALKPVSSSNGWAEGSGVLELFRDHPRLSPLVQD